MQAVGKQGLSNRQHFHLQRGTQLFAKMREDDIVLADMRLPDGDGLLEMSLPPLLKNLREGWHGTKRPFTSGRA